MRWRDRQRSRHVEDRRRAGPGGVAIGGGGMLCVLVVMGLVWLLGGNPLTVLTAMPTGSGSGIVGSTQLAAESRTTLECWHKCTQYISGC